MVVMAKIVRICFQCKAGVIDVGVDQAGKVVTVSCPNQNCIRHGLLAIAWLDAEVVESAEKSGASDPAQPGETITVT
jgi:hypothetical protein